MTEHPFAKLLKISALFSYFLLTGFNNYAGFIDDQLKYNSVKMPMKKSMKSFRQN
jgi:hypothetical protein